MRKIYLIRHAKTQGNLEKRYIGITDEPLSPQGIAELLQKKDEYPNAEIVFISPMKRCVQTADLIYKDTPIIEIESLCECNFGIFENKSYEELKGNTLYQKWIESGGIGEIPKGENSEVFKKRCLKAFSDIIEYMYENNIYSASVIAHGGTFMAILEGFSPIKKDFYHWQIGNCKWLELDIKNKKIEKIKR